VLLRIAAAVGACVLLTAHSPYRQWDVYRKTRLVIVASFEEQEAVRLGRRVAATLARHLPQSRAMFSRARDTNDLIRLVASKQLDVALVDEADAHAAANGARGFSDAGKVPLRSLAQIGPYLLVCRAEFPRAHAYQIAETIAEEWREIVEPTTEAAGPRPSASVRVALHPGAGEYYAGHSPRTPER
jgi:TRAP-type uncharacterized transport system substrate-binding protein